MKVISLKDVPEIQNNTLLFTSPVTLQTPITEEESQYTISWVYFPDGVRYTYL